MRDPNKALENPRMYPEAAGSHLAGERERQRALEQYRKLNDKKHNAKEPMTTQSKKKRKTPVRGHELDPRLVEWIRARVDQVGLDTASGELNASIERCNTDPECVYARGQIRVLLDNPRHRFQAHWHTYFGVWAGFLGNVAEVPTLDPIEVDTAEPSGVSEATDPLLEHQPRPPSSAETGIVRVVEADGMAVPWILSSLTKEAAEQARVSLTDAATLLGYQDKRDLKRLHERHGQEIAEFGMVGTVPVMLARGGGAQVSSSEPAYNCNQLIVLGLSSQTEQGKRIRVWLLKSLNKLVGMFEQIATTGQSMPQAIDYNLMASIVGTAVANAMGPVVQALAGRQQPTAAPPVDHQRLRAVPKPSTVPDAKLVSTLDSIVKIRTETDLDYEVARSMVYDEIERSHDPELRMKANKQCAGNRIDYIRRQKAGYQRKCLECAYRVLVESVIGK